MPQHKAPLIYLTFCTFKLPNQTYLDIHYLYLSTLKEWILLKKVLAIQFLPQSNFFKKIVEELAIHFANTLYTYLIGAMMYIEYAFTKGWHNLWLECDSHLVIYVFINDNLGPWKLCNVLI